MRIFHRLCLFLFIPLSVVCILLFIWLWQTSATLTQEIRTPIPEHIQTWLQHPEQHGMQLQSIACGNGKSRCLIASPSPQIPLAKRGAIIRKQLNAMNTPLSPLGDVKGILVLLHGRGSRKEFMLAIAERFVAAGFICVMPDLPAHGEHKTPQQYFATTLEESHFAADVLATARQHLNQPDLPAALWAMSLGTAFANRSLAVDGQQWKAAVIISGFDDLNSILLDKLDFLPDFLARPVHWLFTRMLKWRFDFNSGEATPKDWAIKINHPLLLVHGDQDRVIYINRGQSLFSAYASQDKTWVNVPTANHHNILVTPMPLYATMATWLLQHLSNK